MERDGESFLARTIEIPLYGHGKDFIEAVDALKYEIESLYEDLMEDNNFTEEWLKIKEYMKMIGSYLCPEFDATAGIGVGVSVEIEDCWKKEIGISLHGGLKIEMGWCQQFVKGFKCASTSILNYYLMQAE